MAKVKCPECHDTVQEADTAPVGSLASIDRDRLNHAHLDGTLLCSEMTDKGYQPSLPVTG